MSVSFICFLLIKKNGMNNIKIINNTSEDLNLFCWLRPILVDFDLILLLYGPGIRWHPLSSMYSLYNNRK